MIMETGVSVCTCHGAFRKMMSVECKFKTHNDLLFPPLRDNNIATYQEVAGIAIRTVVPVQHRVEDFVLTPMTKVSNRVAIPAGQDI